MTHLINDIYSIDLTSLGDQYKSLRILPPDHVWTVPYLKYSYRSTYHTKRRGSDFYYSEEIPLEEGNWQLICTTKEITKEQAISIIDRNGEGWKDYDKDNFHHDIPFPDPLDSLRSLLTEKGLNLNKNYVLIKKLP